MSDDSIEIRPASSADISLVRELFLEYANSLGFSLCFQGFDQELAALPGDYVPPGGALLLARRDSNAMGCIGLRRLESEIGEIKRLYVRPQARGLGLGRALVKKIISMAHQTGYRALRLDTLSTMQEAIALYESLGFREIPPYRHNPVEGARYFELSSLRAQG